MQEKASSSEAPKGDKGLATDYDLLNKEYDEMLVKFEAQVIMLVHNASLFIITLLSILLLTVLSGDRERDKNRMLNKNVD